MASWKPTELTFGTILAFLAPGFIALLAVAYHVDAAAEWLAAAQAAEQSVGVFLFTVLASLTLGVIVSGIRSLVADPFFCSGCGGRWDRITLPRTGWDRLREPDCLAAFSAAVENYYRYYQFYANTAVAVSLLALSAGIAVLIGEWTAEPSELIGAAIGALALVAVLSASAYGSLRRYCDAATGILEPKGGTK